MMSLSTFTRPARIQTICVWSLLGTLPIAGCAANRAAFSVAPTWLGGTRDSVAARDIHASPSLPAHPVARSEEALNSPEIASRPTPTPLAAQPIAELPEPLDKPRLPARPAYPPIRLVSEQVAMMPAPTTALPSTGDATVLPVEHRPRASAAVATVLPVSENTFERQVLLADTAVLVGFSATWCVPCKKLAPTLDEMAAENPWVRIVKVDIDDSPALAARYGVRSVPSLMVFKDGQVVAKQQGVVSKAKLKDMLDL